MVLPALGPITAGGLSAIGGMVAGSLFGDGDGGQVEKVKKVSGPGAQVATGGAQVTRETQVKKTYLDLDRRVNAPVFSPRRSITISSPGARTVAGGAASPQVPSVISIPSLQETGKKTAPERTTKTGTDLTKLALIAGAGLVGYGLLTRGS